MSCSNAITLRIGKHFKIFATYLQRGNELKLFINIQLITNLYITVLPVTITEEALLDALQPYIKKGNCFLQEVHAILIVYKKEGGQKEKAQQPLTQ